MASKHKGHTSPGVFCHCAYLVFNLELSRYFVLFYLLSILNCTTFLPSVPTGYIPAVLLLSNLSILYTS